MAFIRNAWYMACWSKDIKSGEFFKRRLLDEQIVFYRKQDGTAVALFDRCPHRFVPLSMGKLIQDTVMCQYHGLKFDCTGKCIDNPHGNGKIPEAAKVRAYPVVERQGMTWIWMGTGEADQSKIPAYDVLQTDSGFSTSHGYVHLEANYVLMAENLLDLSHITYLHDGYLGSPEQKGADQTIEEGAETITCRRWMPNISVPRIFDMVYRRDGKPVDMWTNMTWVAPCSFILDTGVHEVNGQREDHGWYYGVHILTPETEKTTHYHFAAIMPPGTSMTEEQAQEFSRLRRFAFEQQDKPLMDVQQKVLEDKDFWEMKPVLLSVDVGPVKMRRKIEQIVKAEQSIN